MIERAEGKASAETTERTWNQYAVDTVYRFLPNEELFVGVRYNRAEGELAGIADNVGAKRWQVGGGWFFTPNLLLKAEYVNQKYFGYPSGQHPERRAIQGHDARRRGRLLVGGTLMVIPSSSRGDSSRVGRRRSTRRPIVVWSLGLVLLGVAMSAGVMADGRPQVTVETKDGVYQVVATFHVAQPAAVAVDVLTDYERIPRFMPDVQTSRVIARRDGKVFLEQEAVAKVLMFSKRVHLLLEVEQRPGTIIFHDRCGKSFTHYSGRWQIVEHKDQPTAVVYKLTAQPSFSVPEFLLKRLLKRDATQMIERLQTEMAVRGR